MSSTAEKGVVARRKPSRTFKGLRRDPQGGDTDWAIKLTNNLNFLDLLSSLRAEITVKDRPFKAKYMMNKNS